MIERFSRTNNKRGPVHVDGRAISRARRAAALTQTELSQRMRMRGYSLTQPEVSFLENGLCRLGFTECMATALATELGVGITEITGGRLLSPMEVRRTHELADEIDRVLESPSAGRPPMAA